MSQKGYHIHIVGCLSRSGTTLMKELMVSCFDIDASSPHEQSIFHVVPSGYRVLCTKKPSDIGRIVFPLRVNPKLYVIYMLRDPRDALSSRSHRDNVNGKRIWGNLQDWIDNQTVAEKLVGHPRFITVRYEDLVIAPDDVQAMIARRLPFLKATAKFSAFHTIARPSVEASAALGEVRPISSSSVGNWRNHLPFIKAQIQKYGDISEMLIRAGYETDKRWLALLEDVEADNTDDVTKDRSRLSRLWLSGFIKPRRNLGYLLAHLPVIGEGVRRLSSFVRARLRG